MALGVLVPDFVEVGEAGVFEEDFDLISSEGVQTQEVEVLLQQSHAEAKKGNLEKAKALFDNAKKKLALLKAQVVARKADFNWQWALAVLAIVLAASFYLSSTWRRKPPEAADSSKPILLPALPDESGGDSDRLSRDQIDALLAELRK